MNRAYLDDTIDLKSDDHTECDGSSSLAFPRNCRVFVYVEIFVDDPRGKFI